MRQYVTAVILTALASILAACPGCQPNSASPKPTRGSASVDHRVLTPVAQAELREDAIDLLLQSTVSPSAEARANALEALQPIPNRATEALRAGIYDENLSVRYVAAMSIAQLKLQSLAREVAILLRDENPSVRAAAVYALHACGTKVDVSYLSSLLMQPDPETRGNVAFILGEMGNVSAMQMLNDVARSPMPRAAPPDVRRSRLQIAEALAKLGDNDALSQIRASLYVPAEEGEIQAFAAAMLGRLDDQGSVDTLILLTARKPEFLSAEVRLACAGSLAQLGHPQGGFIADSFRDNPEPAVRAQCAFVYGEIRDEDNLDTLRGMMQDPEEIVRIHSAAAILKITTQ